MPGIIDRMGGGGRRILCEDYQTGKKGATEDTEDT
jgi:hypothetical protein